MEDYPEGPVPGSEIPTNFHFKSRYPAMLHPNFPLPTFFLTLFNVLWFKEHGNDIKYNLNTLEYNTTKFKIINDSTLRLFWKPHACKSISPLQSTLLIYPANRGSFSRISPTSRNGIKSLFPTNISLKILNPTSILDASRKTGTGPSTHWAPYLSGARTGVRKVKSASC